jgi:hypothetical protein
VYRVFKQLGNGEWEYVVSCDELERALQLMEAFHALFPGEYAVRDSAGNGKDVEHANPASPVGPKSDKK